MTSSLESERSSAIERLNSISSGLGIMTTLEINDENDRRTVLNALLNAKNVQDNLGTQINLVNVVAQVVTLTDAATEEQVAAIRTVLLDSDGNGWATTSESIVNSLRDMIAILGQPATWTSPVGIIITRERAGKAGRNFYKINLA